MNVGHCVLAFISNTINHKLLMDDQERITVTYCGQLYDVTPFAQLHPGGASLLRHSNGMDVRFLLDGSESLDGKSHRHSSSAYRILKGYSVLGAVSATPVRILIFIFEYSS
ncbi:hypothetical protein M514_16957 [Trichuris suis]|uniref:Cytochrome b5 heme-binding domain-containing protein n=1 Tax=Trichuris suis TaxID=68888 RepID=A0A085NMY9_9BILA|nr:hypothetical protein M514_16957 [Trichuris suis]